MSSTVYYILLGFVSEGETEEFLTVSIKDDEEPELEEEVILTITKVAPERYHKLRVEGVYLNIGVNI